MGRKVDEIAEADMGSTSGENATVGIIKKRREQTACGEGAAELGLCTRRENKKDLQPSRSQNPPQYGRSNMNAEEDQDTLN